MQTYRMETLAVRTPGVDWQKPYNMVHFAHSDNKGANKVKAGFFASLSGELILSNAIISRHFRDWAEEEMCPIRQPGNPVELRRRRDSLQRTVADLQDQVVGHVIRFVILRSRHLQE